MKVSEVIEKLQKLYETHGDKETRIGMGEGSDLVESVEFVDTETIGSWIGLYSFND